MDTGPKNSAHDRPPSLPRELIVLDIHQIRRDGDTQGRAALSESVIKEYADLMRSGVDFPPVRTWFDGDAYWLSDGFQRVAATELIGLKGISAEVVKGTLADARWDSYAANSSHGLRRGPADIELILRRALEHPNGSHLSNRELARHLSMPEATVRRWRSRVSASPDADTTRLATRAGRTYSIETANIKKSGDVRRRKKRSLEDLRRELNTLKQLASPQGRTLLTIFGSWVFDCIPATVCLDQIEEALRGFCFASGKRGISVGK